jgi:hypothetical protein
VTPKVLQQMVWAGSSLSFEMASEAMLQLAGCNLSAGRIRRQVEQVGAARTEERDQQIEDLKSMTLPDRRSALNQEPAPEVAVVMMDGGRYQRRDHFQPRGGGKTNAKRPDEAPTHWRESKVGCLAWMTSQVHAEDPCPNIPDCFVHASVVREIANTSEKEASNGSLPADEHALVDEKTNDSSSASTDYQAPKLLMRDVVASGKDTYAFGFQLEQRARQLNFNGASRQAFVADGAKTNWRIQQQHFPRATPIADLIHALAYAWSAAQVDEGTATYQKWAQLIWQGDVAEVIEHLQTLVEIHGSPPDDRSNDPRHSIVRALTYFRNNAPHMNYPAYRQNGLPITSAHIESTVKQINRRIKGTEKFWLRETSESVLQLRADYLSDSDPMPKFWLRYLANQDGTNRYQSASKSLQST